MWSSDVKVWLHGLCPGSTAEPGHGFFSETLEAPEGQHATPVSQDVLQQRRHATFTDSSSTKGHMGACKKLNSALWSCVPDSFVGQVLLKTWLIGSQAIPGGIGRLYLMNFKRRRAY
jgi:hypothetical protein